MTTSTSSTTSTTSTSSLTRRSGGTHWQAATQAGSDSRRATARRASESESVSRTGHGSATASATGPLPVAAAVADTGSAVLVTVPVTRTPVVFLPASAEWHSQPVSGTGTGTQLHGTQAMAGILTS